MTAYPSIAEVNEFAALPLLPLYAFGSSITIRRSSDIHIGFILCFFLCLQGHPVFDLFKANYVQGSI